MPFILNWVFFFSGFDNVKVNSIEKSLFRFRSQLRREIITLLFFFSLFCVLCIREERLEIKLAER
jgi:hypothetical protein